MNCSTIFRRHCEHDSAASCGRELPDSRGSAEAVGVLRLAFGRCAPVRFAQDDRGKLHPITVLVAKNPVALEKLFDLKKPLGEGSFLSHPLRTPPVASQPARNAIESPDASAG